MRKNTKKILIVLGILVILFVLASIAAIVFSNKAPGWEKQTSTETIDLSDPNSKTEYAVVHVNKADFLDISGHKFIQNVKQTLTSYQNKIYTTFIFEDGTGMKFPSSTLSSPAFYGEVDDTGEIIKTYGYIIVNGENVSFQEESTLSSDKTSEIYEKIPEKYLNDGIYVNVDENNVVYIKVSIDNVVNNSLMETAKEIQHVVNSISFECKEIHLLINEYDAFLYKKDGEFTITTFTNSFIK